MKTSNNSLVRTPFHCAAQFNRYLQKKRSDQTLSHAGSSMVAYLIWMERGRDY